MKQTLTASLLLLAMSCGNSHTYTSTHMDIEGAPGLEIGYSGLTLELDETIRYHSETQYDSDIGSTSESTVNGLILAFDGTTLRVGETRVEGVHAGDKVELGKAGIVVNGELRAPMPQADN